MLTLSGGLLGCNARPDPATFRTIPGFGVTLPDVPQTLGPLRSLARSVGAQPGTVMWYEQWSWAADFPAASATAIANLGFAPEITWEPWNPAGGVDQPSYSLASIIAGGHDDYLRKWAEEIRSWGGPLRLRFAQEMNGNWYPWGEGVNGNGPGSYVAAWRHVHDVFAAAGVHNVTWVWSPNILQPGAASISDLWPGDNYVNAVALDGYNWGDGSPGTHWTSFADIFASSRREIRALTSLPLFIGEVASGEDGGNKATWIRQMFATLASWPDVRGFTWFDFDKEQDWRIDSSNGSLLAFRSGLATYGR